MFTWQFSSSAGKPKGWYIIALVVVLSLVIYGIVIGLYLMSIVAFLFAGVYILMENNTIPVTRVDINDRMVRVNDTVYDMDKIDRFTLLSNDGNYVMLRLFIKKGIAPIIDIPITPEVDSAGLKEYLSTMLSYDADADWTRTDKLIHSMRL
ncbi:hypothetical protein KBC86_03895 [Candidatus Gracilibacteria bacterium]|nr:hypothetical protein [Candidatus Gracilibacteria bacterium]